jgi:hypothetical protein
MKTWTGEIYQGGVCVGTVSGYDEQVVRHKTDLYARLLGHDGPVEVRFRFNEPEITPHLNDNPPAISEG